MKAHEILRLLVRRLWLLLLLTAIGGGLGAAYAALETPTYTAKAYVVATAEAGDPISALNFAQAYGRVATSGPVLAKAGELLGSDRTGLDSVTASTSPDAPVVEIDATGSSAQHAADVANAVATALTAYGTDRKAATHVGLALLAGATTPQTPSSPKPPLELVVGVAAGLLIGGLAVLAGVGRPEPRPRERNDDTVDEPLACAADLPPGTPAALEEDPDKPPKNARRAISTTRETAATPSTGVPSARVPSARTPSAGGSPAGGSPEANASADGGLAAGAFAGGVSAGSASAGGVLADGVLAAGAFAGRASVGGVSAGDVVAGSAPGGSALAGSAPAEVSPDGGPSADVSPADGSLAGVSPDGGPSAGLSPDGGPSADFSPDGGSLADFSRDGGPLTGVLSDDGPSVGASVGDWDEATRELQPVSGGRVSHGGTDAGPVGGGAVRGVEAQPIGGTRAVNGKVYSGGATAGPAAVPGTEDGDD